MTERAGISKIIFEAFSARNVKDIVNEDVNVIVSRIDSAERNPEWVDLSGCRKETIEKLRDDGWRIDGQKLFSPFAEKKSSVNKRSFSEVSASEEKKTSEIEVSSDATESYVENFSTLQKAFLSIQEQRSTCESQKEIDQLDRMAMTVLQKMKDLKKNTAV